MQWEPKKNQMAQIFLGFSRPLFQMVCAGGRICYLIQIFFLIRVAGGRGSRHPGRHAIIKGVQIGHRRWSHLPVTLQGRQSNHPPPPSRSDTEFCRVCFQAGYWQVEEGYSPQPSRVDLLARSWRGGHLQQDGCRVGYFQLCVTETVAQTALNHKETCFLP